MKVNMLFASIALCLAIHCFGGSKISSDTQPQKSVIQSKDTVVNVSERFAILYKNMIKILSYGIIHISYVLKREIPLK